MVRGLAVKGKGLSHIFGVKKGQKNNKIIFLFYEINHKRAEYTSVPTLFVNFNYA